jgi:tRNA threonylcarbamoyladenosine dehydratase
MSNDAHSADASVDTRAAPALANIGVDGGGSLSHGADLERRFGGLRRLYGDDGYARIRALRVAVIGLGGVGSWAVEALARSGVAALVLVDLDHVAESNINRQVQAVGRTVGQAKSQALAERVADIHPECAVRCVEEFVNASNWPALLPAGVDVDVVIDACDQVRAKVAIAAWALAAPRGLVVVGAAGGKRRPEEARVEDLATVTHDPLLAAMRQRLRQQHGAPRAGPIGVACVFSREPVVLPARNEQVGTAPAGDGDGPERADRVDLGAGLNCHGYGSSVAVTATFGLVAASRALELGARVQTAFSSVPPLPTKAVG